MGHKRNTPPKRHLVNLTDADKVKWFSDRIAERQRIAPVTSPEGIEALVNDVRVAFQSIHGRDVPGSFIRRLLKDLGVDRGYSESTLQKRQFMFHLMDKNANYRTNKVQLRKVVEQHFGEKILDMVFDELFDEYSNISDHPKPKVDIDIYGQKALFD